MTSTKTDAEKQRSKTNRHTVIEGWLYWYTAFGSGILTYLASEESYKYINAGLRFWMIMLIGSSIGGFNALKAFRSMTFGRAYGSNTAPDLAPTLPKPELIQKTIITNTPNPQEAL